jgi:hypothetical protein
MFQSVVTVHCHGQVFFGAVFSNCEFVWLVVGMFPGMLLLATRLR